MSQTPKGQTMSHTPGPWRISGCRADKDNLLIEHGNSETKSPLLAMLYHDEHRLPMDANARLIAAAPELLAALKLYFSAPERFNKAASDAIAHAEGQK